MTPGALTDEEQKVVRQAAIDRCTHPDEWVSVTEDERFTADACWACILDAYFEHVE